MDTEDPITTFFPGEEDADLYTVLSLGRDVKAEDIKKAYRRLALVYHPDKHASAAQDARDDASRKFQQIGFAYAVLSDEKRRLRYDRTGRTDDGGVDFGPGESGSWETYFEELFDQITKGKLDELKREYQSTSQLPLYTFSAGLMQQSDSTEELEDLKCAYNDAEGSLDEIMDHMPHSTIEDEPRFVRLITNLIKSGDLTSTPTWQKSVKDETARLKRKKKSAKEAEEAEALAKEIGVWEEFYGSGKPTDKATKKKKGKRKADTGDEEEDVSALQALILKRKKNMDELFDGIAAKYAEPEPSTRSGGSRGKKRKADIGEDPPTKKFKTIPPPPDIDDDEFTKIRESLLKKRTPAPPKPRSTSKGEVKRKAKR